MMKHSSCQFGDQFSGFGCQSEKFSCIGTCIMSNFMPFYVKLFFIILNFDFISQGSSKSPCCFGCTGSLVINFLVLLDSK